MPAGICPSLVAKQDQDWLDRRVALTERQVGALILLPIFEVQGDNLVVMLRDELHRVEFAAVK